MPQPAEAAGARSANILDQRPGYRLNTQWGSVAVLEGGGHICGLGLHQVPGVNPLWKPPWTTIDPQHYSRAKHARAYGPPPDGSLLAGIAGHSLSFDHFGPPSHAEIKAGLTTHGEAPSARWKKLALLPDEPSLTYGCTLREAQIRFQRTISLDRDHPVIRCEASAENLSSYDRPISWAEHVTFGPPFLEAGTTIFDIPATNGKVCPQSYSDKMFLAPDAEFAWPRAPRKDGGYANLRGMENGRFGHYTAQLIDPELDVAFVSACNPTLGLLVVYLFRRTDFPWVGNWEQSGSWTAAPWNGKTFCRGIEFSTTPFPAPRRETVDHGALFGEKIYRWLPAKSNFVVRWLTLLLQVPREFRGLERVAIRGKKAHLTESKPGNHEYQVAVGDFFKK